MQACFVVWGHLGHLTLIFYYSGKSGLLQKIISCIETPKFLSQAQKDISAHAPSVSVLKRFVRPNQLQMYLTQNSFTFVLKMACHIFLTYELW